MRLSIEQALREAGAIDRTLRKRSKAYIVAPPDSPPVRMARGFAEAAVAPAADGKRPRSLSSSMTAATARDARVW